MKKLYDTINLYLSVWTHDNKPEYRKMLIEDYKRKYLLKVVPLIFGVVFLFGCRKIDTHHDKQWKTYTIYTGDHSSTPGYFQTYTARERIDSGCAKIDTGLIYDLESNDQLDWNKLRGFRFGTGTFNGSVPKTTAIVAWRYNPKDSVVEVAPYFNNYPSEPYVFPDSSEIVKCKLGTVVHWVRKYHRGNKRAEIIIWNDSTIVSKYRNVGRRNLYYSVGFWFGGNRTAPKNITIEIKD